MVYVLSVPYVPPLPPDYIAPRRRLKHWLYGWDGSVWELTDPSKGVFLVTDGVEGLGMPKITNYTTDSPVVNGVSWDGFIVPGRDVFLSIMIYHDNADEDWVELDRAFWKIFRPGKVIRWVIEGPSGKQLSLNLRYKEGGDVRFENDPVARGWQVYGISLFPEQPLWEGPAITPQPYINVNATDFYGPTGNAPDFYITQASNAGTATVDNPGDVESWPVWTITGPATSSRVGIGSVYTDINFNVPDGSVLRIDTNPLAQTATLDGVDVMKQLGNFDFVPVPAEDGVQLSLLIAGLGKIEIAFVPLYLRGIP